ncbi:MAG: hypothetical protein QOG09_1037 [Solirubrobacterales bacterium]|jgi:vacuolar-type H+-ATPase subunit H|nr:hypothetical protein [Solirubrobacterales bacterium]
MTHAEVVSRAERIVAQAETDARAEKIGGAAEKEAQELARRIVAEAEARAERIAEAAEREAWQLAEGIGRGAEDEVERCREQLVEVHHELCGQIEGISWVERLPMQESPPEPATGEVKAAPVAALAVEGDSDGGTSSEGVRLVALQMAASGSAHGEITVRLRDEFHVTNASDIASGVLEQRSSRRRRS